MTSRLVLLGFVGKFLWFFIGGLDLTSENDVWLNGFGEIEIPYFDLRKEAGDDGVVSLGGIVAVDGSEIDFEPLDVKREGAKHDLMVNE